MSDLVQILDPQTKCFYRLSRQTAVYKVVLKPQLTVSYSNWENNITNQKMQANSDKHVVYKLMQISPSDPNWGMRSGFIPATCWTLIDPVPSGFCIIRWSHSYHSPILGYKKTPWVWVNQVSFLIPPWSPILIAKSLFLDTSTLVYHIEKPMRFKGILSTNSRFQRQTCVRFGRALGDETP